MPVVLLVAVSRCDGQEARVFTDEWRGTAKSITSGGGEVSLVVILSS